MRHQLVGFLGSAIQRQWMIDILVYGKRHGRVGAIDRTRRGVDQVCYAMMPAPFEDMQRANNVALDIGVRIFYGVADTGLCRKMHDFLKVLFRKQFLYGIAILQIDTRHFEIVKVVENRRPGLFEADVIVVVKIIQTDDGVATFE